MVVLINNRVGSNQLINLSELFHVKVIDRDLLILEIFELNAQTRESQLQIKLARLNLEVSRKEKEISQKVKYEHQGKDFKGKGYSTIDAYRHAFKEQRKKITDELSIIRKNRSVQRKSRKGEFNVAIVGYTGSGKTTFLNAIKETQFKTKSSLFTTVTTVSKRLGYKGDSIIFTDTVGFVYDIPHQIIEAFLSTLEETSFSDCILILTDISEPIEKIHQKIQTTFVILAKIGALQIPIIYVFNKIDKIDPIEFTVKKSLTQEILPPKSLIFYISALHKEKLSDLLDALIMVKNKKIILKIDEDFNENILNLYNKKYLTKNF